MRQIAGKICYRQLKQKNQNCLMEVDVSKVIVGLRAIARVQIETCFVCLA
jgi:hypothetical protein